MRTEIESGCGGAAAAFLFVHWRIVTQKVKLNQSAAIFSL
jgi:hypothetical protein